MILIDKVLVSEDIITTKFHCHLSECKGACCTFKGEYGAPLLNNEIELVEASKEAAAEYLSERSIGVLKKKGFYEGKADNYSTICIEETDCVFVFYEGDIAKCALEKAYLDGKTKFRKPLSCHLFPIRVSNFGGDYLYYSKFPECDPALAHGEEQGIHIYESVKEALIRAYGEEWFTFFDEYVRSQNTDV